MSADEFSAQQPVSDLGFRGPFPGNPFTSVGYGVARRQQGNDLHAWQLVLPPGGRFTHLTAAAIYGWRLPELRERLPVFAAVSPGDPRPVRQGLRIAQTVPFDSPRVIGGLRVDSPADVIINAARDLALLDLVVLIDSALKMGHCTREVLKEAAGRRRRGAPRLRKALGLADVRSESAWESVTRCLHVVAGYAVQPQVIVVDEAGDFVARVDLMLSGTCFAHEVDGKHHERQRREDGQRDRRLLDAGVIRRGYTTEDVRTTPAAIIRDAASSTGRRPDPGWMGRWTRLMRESSFTASGKRRLVDRCWTQRKV